MEISTLGSLVSIQNVRFRGHLQPNNGRVARLLGPTPFDLEQTFEAAKMRQTPGHLFHTPTTILLW